MKREHAAGPVRRGLVVALLVLTVLVTYARVLDAPFVSDDRSILLDGPLVRSAHAWRDYVAAFWVGSYFRPLTMLSYRFDYLVNGESALGFHATNLAWHALNTGLLFAWTRRLGAGLAASAATTLLWAVHPSVTETVCWVSARGDALALAFVLAALLVWPADEDDRPLRVVAATVLFFLGLLAKEVALAFVPVVLLPALARRAARGLLLRRALPLACAVAGYDWLRWHALVGVDPVDVPRAAQPWLTLAAAGTYARILVGLHPAYLIGLPTDVEPVMIALGTALSIAAAVLFVALVRRRDSGRLAAAALAIGGLVPVLHIVRFPSHTLVADRYLYVPAAGLAAFAALAATGRGARVRRAALLAVATALSLAYLVTWRRIDDWRDEVRFWLVSARDASLRDMNPIANLAATLAREQRCDRAIPLLAPLVDRGPGNLAPKEYESALANLVACRSNMGRHDDAISLARVLVGRRPEGTAPLRALGVAAMSAQRFAEARSAFQRWLARDPASDDARAWLDIASAASAAPAEPAATDPPTLQRIAWLQQIGAVREAESAWRRLLVSTPPSPAVASIAATYLLQRGSANAAQLAVAAAAPPDDSSARAIALRLSLEARLRVDAEIDAAAPILAVIARRFER